MNAYATTDQATIQLHNTAATHRANRFMVGASPSRPSDSVHGKPKLRWRGC